MRKDRRPPRPQWATPGESDRRRIVSWEDPAPAAAAARDLSGLEFLGAMVAGRIPPPPIGALVGLELVEVHEGRAVFTLEPAECHYNPIGSMHGGMITTLLDSAMSCAVHTTLPKGTGYTTLDLNVTFLRPVTVATGRLRGEGRAVHVGSRVGTAEGRVTDTAGKLYATGTTTCVILPATQTGR